MNSHHRSLHGKKVAILATEGFEEVELTEPRKALEEAGAQTFIVAPKGGEIRAWRETDWGDSYHVDESLDSTRAEDYDALLLPGGVLNPDKLRMDERALQFVKHFFNEGKPVAAICHGPLTMIDAGVVKGRSVTSYPSIKADLTNAGAMWLDREVVVDNGLVTSRKPDDLEAFCEKMIEEFAEGRHRFQTGSGKLEPAAPALTDG